METVNVIDRVQIMVFHRQSKSEALNSLTLLVEKYLTQRGELESTGSGYTETEARGEFIDPFLQLLGWDVNNEDGVVQSLRDVVQEHPANFETFVIGRPDYRLKVRGRDRLPVEAKKPSVTLLNSAKSSQQARSYGWSLSLPAAVLTNFAETVIFGAQEGPREDDSADVGVIPGCRIAVTEYVEKFDLLWQYLSFETVSDDDVFNQTHHYVAPPRGNSQFDRTFLQHFRKWRLELAQDIASNNVHLSAPEVGRRTQRLLNALLFLRVCEDRDIWQYEALLKSARAKTLVESFARADKVFNAGLFTVLLDTAVSSAALEVVAEELYWPRTKFAFGLMQPEILADLYEQYLFERVELDTNRIVKLVAKPELSHAGGVVPTPAFIVDELVSQTVDVHLAEPSGFADGFRLLDPACGSGVFLLTVFARLIEHAETQGVVGIAARSDLALKHLFGVDIDGEAVEVCRLSLLLSVLGDDVVSASSSQNLLPDLSRNIRSGNAVISTDFDAIQPEAAAIVHRRASVSPFSWSGAFPDAMAAGGFDVVIGNPPYVRIQTLRAHAPDQLDYFQDPRSGFESSQSFNFDLFLLFIERAVSLLRPGGTLAFIVPHRFTTGLAGGAVRNLLSSRLRRLVHFGEAQVFPGRSTYTALVIVGDETSEDAVFELVADLEAWKSGSERSCEQIERGRLTADPWPIATSKRLEIFDRMKKTGVAHLGDPGWVDIFVGVQTSADNVYFVTPEVVQPSDPRLTSFLDAAGTRWVVEAAITRPAIKKRRLAPYDKSPEPDRLALYPYAIEAVGGTEKLRARPLSVEEMTRDYPLALEYFEANRPALRGRNITPDPGDRFWAYGRSQSLTKLDSPKIIVRTLSLIPQYVSDPDGLVVPGGGDGGPYYLLRLHEDCRYSENVIIALLSHPAVDAFVASHGKAYEGSYIVHRKAFLKSVPIPELGSPQRDDLELWVDELQSNTARLRSETDSGVRTSVRDRSIYLREQIEASITKAYGLGESDLHELLG